MWPRSRLTVRLGTRRAIWGKYCQINYTLTDGTGTEDYFCGSYNFENQETKRYQTFSTPHSGLAQVLPPDVIYRTGQRFGLCRWHVADPIRFAKDLKVTIQTPGWMQEKSGRYLPLHDDVASVA